MYAAAELGLSDLLAARARTSDELAEAAGMHPPSLHRLLRALSRLGVLAVMWRRVGWRDTD